ncbi:hypothetical protein Ae201684P_020710 [Aphanomyces euteiches]|nr:hypothetical protein Ae201684P_020710 [Aphanomyces euteiches]
MLFVGGGDMKNWHTVASAISRPAALHILDTVQGDLKRFSESLLALSHSTIRHRLIFQSAISQAHIMIVAVVAIVGVVVAAFGLRVVKKHQTKQTKSRIVKLGNPDDSSMAYENIASPKATQVKPLNALEATI